MTTFSYAVDWAAQVAVKPRVLKAQFGDGYDQRVADGINISPRIYRLEFKNRDDDERDDIIEFFEAANGVNSFDWTPPVGSSGVWVCEEWSESPTQVDRTTISTMFREVFE